MTRPFEDLHFGDTPGGVHGHPSGEPFNFSIWPDRAAPNCDDQLALVSRVGRGLTGNSSRVGIKFDNCSETYLEGMMFDSATRTWNSEWISENINAGHLSYQYNLRPWTVPQTFTITFTLVRPRNRFTGNAHLFTDCGGAGQPGRCEWSWTTPPIPYLWDTDDDGNPIVESTTGSGLANLYVRESIRAPWVDQPRHGPTWIEPPLGAANSTNTGRWGQLNWPMNMGPRQFNTPGPTNKWAATITFGFGGDIELPNLDDLARIIGTNRGELERILSRPTIQPDIPGFAEADNIIDYILRHVRRILNLLGANPGDQLPFPPDRLPGDGGPFNNFYTWILSLRNRIRALELWRYDMDAWRNWVNINIGDIWDVLDNLQEVQASIPGVAIDVRADYPGGIRFSTTGTMSSSNNWPITLIGDNIRRLWGMEHDNEIKLVAMSRPLSRTFVDMVGGSVYTAASGNRYIPENHNNTPGLRWGRRCSLSGFHGTDHLWLSDDFGDFNFWILNTTDSSITIRNTLEGTPILIGYEGAHSPGGTHYPSGNFRANGQTFSIGPRSLLVCTDAVGLALTSTDFTLSGNLFFEAQIPITIS